jgi:hypothetical protein
MKSLLPALGAIGGGLLGVALGSLAHLVLSGGQNADGWVEAGAAGLLLGVYQGYCYVSLWAGSTDQLKRPIWARAMFVWGIVGGLLGRQRDALELWGLVALFAVAGLVVGLDLERRVMRERSRTAPNQDQRPS